MAVDMIQDICREAELDRIYVGKVKSIKEFGAFVEIMPGTEGLLHISQIAENRIRAVGDVLSEGDIVAVKVHRDRRQRQDPARRARRRCAISPRWPSSEKLEDRARRRRRAEGRRARDRSA